MVVPAVVVVAVAVVVVVVREMLTKPVPSTVIKSLILKLLIISQVMCVVLAIAKIITDMNNVDFLRFCGGGCGGGD
ncbi:MAG: hypothetical protein KAF91_11915 [Nostoc sp. TH1S01]|nr:hypothetical protein [Nostoc sp. TH1S01]